MAKNFKYDVFISHATEDKDSVARPLAIGLRKAGLRVWFDEFTLKAGDSLRESIDRGLLESQYGVLVLSPKFFAKKWTNRELNGLTALEMSDGRKRLIPIWHGVDYDGVVEYSPPLADTLAFKSTDGSSALIRKIIAHVSRLDDDEDAVYDFVHRGVNVDLVELSRSLGGPVAGHWFQNCHLVGPAVLGLMDEISLVGATIEIAQLWTVDRNRPYSGGIELNRCRIEGCTFENVGFAAPAEILSRIYYLPSAPNGGTPDGEGPNTP